MDEGTLAAALQQLETDVDGAPQQHTGQQSAAGSQSSVQHQQQQPDLQSVETATGSQQQASFQVQARAAAVDMAVLTALTRLLEAKVRRCHRLL